MPPRGICECDVQQPAPEATCAWPFADTGRIQKTATTKQRPFDLICAMLGLVLILTAN